MSSTWFVETGKQAHAFLGNSEVSHTFRFNPDNVSWGYAENIVPFDTIGGRVLQVLSGKTNSIIVNGRAGSRGELQRLAQNCSDIMKYHIRTQDPVFFKVPSREWNFVVYLQAVPQLGWSVADTSYPYQIVLDVIDDLQGLATQEMRAYTLERLATGIGYNPDVHGGDGPGFAELVNNLQLDFNSDTAINDTTGTSGTGSGGTGGTGGDAGSGGGGGTVPTPTGFAYANETTYAGTIDFSRRTGTTPDWVKQRPNLYRWNGTTLQEDTMKSFQDVCKRLSMKVTNSTSYRTYEEQQRLYNLYLAGNGNKAAKPGTSYHEIGLAIDMNDTYYKQTVVVNTFYNNGWNRGVSGEPWHFTYRVSG